MILNLNGISQVYWSIKCSYFLLCVPPYLSFSICLQLCFLFECTFICTKSWNYLKVCPYFNLVWFACLLGLQLLLWHLFVCLFLPCVLFISCPNNSLILPFITPTFLSLLSCLFLWSMQNTCETAGSGIQSHWPSFLRRALWTCVHFTSYLLRIPGRYPGIVLIVLLKLIYRNISAISCYWNQDNLCEH